MQLGLKGMGKLWKKTGDVVKKVPDNLPTMGFSKARCSKVLGVKITPPKAKSVISLNEEIKSISKIIDARRKTAYDFYQKHNPNMREAKIQEHLNGIDFTKPVYVVKIPPNGLGKNKNELYQYTKLDSEGNVRQGNYYTDNPKNTPTELGISDKYSVRDNNWKPTGEIKQVEQNVFEFNIEKPVEGLKSTSKQIIDDWSIENIDGVKIEVPTKGGGSQIYIPKQ